MRGFGQATRVNGWKSVSKSLGWRDLHLSDSNLRASLGRSPVNLPSFTGISTSDDNPTPFEAVNQTVRRAQEGDADAFRMLYEEHGGRVFALCLRLSGDRAEAEELTQDVFVRVWERLETFRGDSAFSTWLHRLAINEVLGEKRSASRRARRVLSTDQPELLERPRADSGQAGHWDLDAAIAGLPEGARTVFVLYDVEGYRHEEIASMTGIAEGTSKAQLHRARRLLREKLQR
jgi:RNA polymerase sigma-70 factor (ECF subfamily)